MKSLSRSRSPTRQAKRLIATVPARFTTELTSSSAMNPQPSSSVNCWRPPIAKRACSQRNAALRSMRPGSPSTAKNGMTAAMPGNRTQRHQQAEQLQARTMPAFARRQQSPGLRQHVHGRPAARSRTGGALRNTCAASIHQRV